MLLICKTIMVLSGIGAVCRLILAAFYDSEDNNERAYKNMVLFVDDTISFILLYWLIYWK